MSEPLLSRVDDWVRRRPLVFDAALAAALAMVLGPASVASALVAGWTPAITVAVLAALGVGHLAVLLRRRYPALAYGAVSASMLVLVLSPDVVQGPATLSAAGAFPPIVLPSALVYPAVLYAAAAYGTPPLPVVSLVVGLVGAAMTSVRLWSTGDWWQGPGSPGFPSGNAGWRLFVVVALVAAVLAPWGLGRFRGVRAAYVSALEERAARAEQDRAERARQAAKAERARIARELHDVVAHSLAVIVRQAEGGRFVAAKQPERAVAALDTVAATGREALSDMRSLLGVLRDRDTRADAGPQPDVNGVPALVDRMRSAGLDVELRTSGTPVPLDRTASLAAYRVVQESLTNVVKHAGQHPRAKVQLRWGGGDLEVTVSDDGGDDARPEPREPGHGLLGMRERVQLAGGELDANARNGSGFTVRARLPARDREVAG